MTFVITQPCCNDASCVAVCPVNCIHPTPDEPDFGTAEMLYIDPVSCIDCAACVVECPVEAILSEDELEEDELPFLELNAAYYAGERPALILDQPSVVESRDEDYAGLRVAVVGSGPAALYAATELASHEGVEITIVERLLSPYGLIRFGVAPDHPRTKDFSNVFRSLWSKPGVRIHLGIDVGRDITLEELRSHHHAVIYATGAEADRDLGIPGADLPGSHGAAEFVGWYNGHPDHAASQFDFSGDRAVIIGNGNVALDLARILVSDVEALAKTDIADHALEALRTSGIREVVIVGRRGPAQSAFTASELLALTSLADIDVLVEPFLEPTDVAQTQVGDAIHGGHTDAFKVDILSRLAATQPTAGRKRIVLRYFESPTEIVGSRRATGVKLASSASRTRSSGPMVEQPSGTHTLSTHLVLRAIGYRSTAPEGLPFDTVRGTLPNEGGRVIDPEVEGPVAGVYATGWVKRGPSGGIGTNRTCAAETVAALLEDFSHGRLATPARQGEFQDLVASRQPEAIDFDGWLRIDRAERAAGAGRRPRVKLVDTEDLRKAARPGI